MLNRPSTKLVYNVAAKTRASELETLRAKYGSVPALNRNYGNVLVLVHKLHGRNCVIYTVQEYVHAYT